MAVAAEEFARQRQHMHHQHEAAQEQQRAAHQAVLVQQEEERAALEAKLEHALGRAEAAETPLLSVSLRPMLLPVRAKGSNTNTLAFASPPPLLLRHGMRLGRSDFCEDYTSADSSVSRAHISVEIGGAGEIVLRATAANVPYVRTAMARRWRPILRGQRRKLIPNDIVAMDGFKLKVGHGIAGARSCFVYHTVPFSSIYVVFCCCVYANVLLTLYIAQHTLLVFLSRQDRARWPEGPRLLYRFSLVHTNAQSQTVEAAQAQKSESDSDSDSD